MLLRRGLAKGSLLWLGCIGEVRDAKLDRPRLPVVLGLEPAAQISASRVPEQVLELIRVSAQVEQLRPLLVPGILDQHGAVRADGGDGRRAREVALEQVA